MTKRELDGLIEEQKDSLKNYFDLEKLATYYILKDHLFTETVTENIIEYEGKSEFSGVINGKVAVSVWEVMEELMETIKVLQPRIYSEVIAKIQKNQ